MNDHGKPTLSHDDFIDLEMKKIYTIYKDKYGLAEISTSRYPSKYFSENNREAFAELFVLSEIGDKDNAWYSVIKEYLKGINK